MNEVPKIYLSGRISNRSTDETLQQFKEAKEKLSGKGYLVVDPTRLGLGEDRSWNYYMKEGLKLMLDCDGIYMLKGWETSSGANIEFKLAFDVGIPIYSEGANDLKEDLVQLNG